MLKNKSEFTKNIVTLITGTAVAQAIPIAISPILTRIYTPEDFGVFALFIAIISIFGIIANARYELAIMLPKKDEDAINIFVLGFIITCFITLFLLILVIVFNDYLKIFLENEEIGFWLYFVPIAVFFSGMYNILNYFNNRKKNYKDLRNATILKAIVLAIVQLSIGFIKSGASGLISGQLISNMFANIKLLKNILKDKMLVSKISKIKIIALAKKYKKFPKYSLPSSFCDIITTQLPFFLLPKIFGLQISGFFFLSKRIISLPASLIASSISQVYFQNLSDAKKNKERVFPIFIDTIKKLFLIALPTSLLMFLFSPIIFEIIFGKDWLISGEIAKYLALVFFITFIVSPLSISFTVSMELRRSAFWQYLYLITSSCLFLIFLLNDYELKTFLFYFVLHEYILYGIYLYMIFRTVKDMDNFKKV